MVEKDVLLHDVIIQMARAENSGPKRLSLIMDVLMLLVAMDLFEDHLSSRQGPKPSASLLCVKPYPLTIPPTQVPDPFQDGRLLF